MIQSIKMTNSLLGDTVSGGWGGSFLARPLSVVSGEPGILDGIGAGTWHCRVRLPKFFFGRSLLTMKSADLPKMERIAIGQPGHAQSTQHGRVHGCM